MTIYLALSVIAVVLGVVVTVVFKSRMSGGSNVGAHDSNTGKSNAVLKVVTKESGLKIETLKAGSGTRMSEQKDIISVHYTGWLTTGEKFDSSLDRGTPFEFKLGQGKVIHGWEEGLKGMVVGEKRRLTIPSQLGYGNRGTGRIPPRATLIFEVELINIR